MPIYEYKCELCGHQLEMLKKIRDEPAKTCPACGGDGLRKLVSAAAFKLKGTGWYETDFKDKKTKKDDNKTPDKGNTDTKKATESNSKSSESKSDSGTKASSKKPSANSSGSG